MRESALPKRSIAQYLFSRSPVPGLLSCDADVICDLMWKPTHLGAEWSYDVRQHLLTTSDTGPERRVSDLNLM
jgi:hypothetical protein